MTWDLPNRIFSLLRDFPPPLTPPRSFLLLNDEEMALVQRRDSHMPHVVDQQQGSRSREWLAVPDTREGFLPKVGMSLGPGYCEDEVYLRRALSSPPSLFFAIRAC